MLSKTKQAKFKVWKLKFGKLSKMLSNYKKDSKLAFDEDPDTVAIVIGNEKTLSLGDEKTVIALKDCLDLKLDTINKTISVLQEEMVRLIAMEQKDGKLQWAITNAELNHFQFNRKGLWPTAWSDDFIRKALFEMRKGKGYRIVRFGIGHHYHEPSNPEAQDKADEKEFRDAFQKQIYGLTGVKPRLELDPDCGDYYIHYC